MSSHHFPKQCENMHIQNATKHDNVHVHSMYNIKKIEGEFGTLRYTKEHVLSSHNLGQTKLNFLGLDMKDRLIAIKQ